MNRLLRYALGIVSSTRVSREMFGAIILLLCMGAGLILSERAAYAQGTAAVEGTVTDSKGNGVPGTKVTLKLLATSAERSATTDESGYYRISGVVIGVYELTFEHAGFNTTVLKQVHLQVDQVAKFDVALKIGEVRESISVQGEAPLVDTSSTAVGGVIDNRQIIQLPLNGRYFLQLALLFPGAMASPQGTTQSQWGTVGGRIGFSVSGNRDSLNVFTLDGVNVMDRNYNTITVSPSVDVVQEFKIVANAYSAQYGMLPGAQVDIVTRSGANQYHGTAFEFLRNSALDAKNFFDAPSRAIPPFKQNQFGGTFGGPIVKDRTFFFANYEGFRVRQSLTQLTVVPTAAMRSGDLSGTNPGTGLPFPVVRDPVTGIAFTSNQIPVAQINPLAAAVLARIPLPNIPGALPGQFNRVAVGQHNLGNDQGGIRIDHQLSSRISLFGRYTDQRNAETEPFVIRFTPGTPPPEGFGDVRTEHGRNLSVGMTYVLTSRMVNEFRFGYNQLRANRQSQNVGVDLLGLLHIPRYGSTLNTGIPFFNVTGFGQMGDSDNLQPNIRKNDSFQWKDDITYTRGKFTHHWGVDFRENRSTGVTDTFSQGEFRFGDERLGFGQTMTGTAFGDFLLDRPRVSLIQLGTGLGSYRFHYFGSYYAASWRVLPSFTLDFGLRWEFETAPTPVDGQFTSILDVSKGAIILSSQGGTAPPLTDALTQYFINTFGTKFLTNTQAGLPASTNQSHYKNFAPRFGFVWDTFKNARFIVRGGAGLFTNLQERPYEVSSNRLGPPFAPTIVSFQNALFVPGLTPLTYENVFAQGGPANRPASDGGPSTGGVPSGVRPGSVQQWTLSLQSQITPNLMAEAVYVGSHGVHVNGFYIANQNVPNSPTAPAFSPDPRFGESFEEHSQGMSWYHGVTLRLQQRVSKGLTFSGGYTFAKSEDTVSTFTGGPTDAPVPQNSYDLAGNKGLSNFDVRQRFILSFLYELPFGKGKHYLNQGGIAAAIFGDWQLGGVLTLQGGQPFSVQLTGNVSGISASGADRPNCLSNPNLGSGQSPNRWFDTAAFTLPTRIIPTMGFPYRLLGNCGRNIVTGPTFKNYDNTLSKRIQITERQALEFRAEFFNLFNHPNFNMPDRFFGSATFGKVSSARFPRQIQFGLRYSF